MCNAPGVTATAGRASLRWRGMRQFEWNTRSQGLRGDILATAAMLFVVGVMPLFMP